MVCFCVYGASVVFYALVQKCPSFSKGRGLSRKRGVRANHRTPRVRAIVRWSLSRPLSNRPLNPPSFRWFTRTLSSARLLPRSKVYERLLPIMVMRRKRFLVGLEGIVGLVAERSLVELLELLDEEVRAVSARISSRLTLRVE